MPALVDCEPLLSGKDKNAFEVIYVNDGSSDKTLATLQSLADADARVKVVNLSRNFGKEVATTAGVSAATGDAVVILDADGQHPPHYLPQFIERWRGGVPRLSWVYAQTTVAVSSKP
ncbi:glycosyltransferase [Rothia sp. ZJ1223]|uniref:glycosyltransferase n=1 Tax=Rothia sp. ZJ1223 TaxID=2811098 RepID=UPI00195E3F23|nr:glycosyltransferase [Rothia sp. ZJ1223]MBM7051755.1 glycosyltransferase [Rothia sp. ZJ1223]